MLKQKAIAHPRSARLSATYKSYRSYKSYSSGCPPLTTSPRLPCHHLKFPAARLELLSIPGAAYAGENSIHKRRPISSSHRATELQFISPPAIAASNDAFETVPLRSMIDSRWQENAAVDFYAIIFILRARAMELACRRRRTTLVRADDS